MIDVARNAETSQDEVTDSTTVASRRGELLFLAPGDIGKGRVEPISWMRTCDAYAKLGFDVSLMTLRVRQPDAVDRAGIWEHYGLERSFSIVRLPTPLGREASVWWFRLWAGGTALVVAALTIARRALQPMPTLVHARLPVLAAPFLVLRHIAPPSRRPRVILETHSLPRSSHSWVIRSVDLVVTNSAKLASDITSRFGIPSERVLHAPLGSYNDVTPQPRDEARALVQLPADTFIACYTGKLTEEHGAFLLQTAAELRKHIPRLLFVVVGGNPSILDWLRSRTRQLGLSDIVVLTGFVPPAKVGLYQSSADVLVYHMPESMEIFDYCTPAKGFEYQAAQRPIVATDIPLFEEVFGSDGERAIRVRERTPEAMADGIRHALEMGHGGKEMSERAAEWVSKRTWKGRTAQIVEALGL